MGAAGGRSRRHGGVHGPTRTTGGGVKEGTYSLLLTPLFIASHFGHLEIVRLLVEAGADKDKAVNSGKTPLYIARQRHHDDIVEMLQRAGATC